MLISTDHRDVTWQGYKLAIPCQVYMFPDRVDHEREDSSPINCGSRFERRTVDIITSDKQIS